MRGYTEPGRTVRLLRSSIGAKFLMAVTGLLLLFFLFGHLTGNLLVFRGRETMNGYAEWLHDHPGLVWTTRIGLLAIFSLHIALALRLTSENRDARSSRYRFDATVQATTTSRTMILTGLLILAFVVYHLLHFTLHVIDTGGMGTMVNGKLDVYGMVLTGFKKPVIAMSYFVAIAILGLHLWHGIGSAFQTLGWSHPAWNSVGKFLSVVVPLVVFVGYSAIPLSIWFGVLK
jgi:succinate dehydrogenase / fumarate reductase cytochrome b subunit